MGVIHSKQQSKPNDAKREPELNTHSSSSSDNYAKEIAAYQKAVYHNCQPSHQIMKQLSVRSADIGSVDLALEEESQIQSTYANSIAVLITFWNSNVNTLADHEYALLAMQFYTNVFNAIPEAHALFLSAKKDMSTQSKIFLGMFGWLLQNISQPNSNHLLHRISILGQLHETMGVTLSYYLKMGGAFHKTMGDKFDKQYTMRTRFCFNTLYEIVVNIMIGQDFRSKCTQQRGEMDAFIKHINDFRYCLDDDDALEYLGLFMKQQFCGELALYYKDYKAYKLIKDPEERNKKGQEIKRLYIDEKSEREINISFQRRDAFVKNVTLKQNKYDVDEFDDISLEITKLIRNNVYPRFFAEITKLYKEIKVKPKEKVTQQNYDQNWNFLVDRLNQTPSSTADQN